MKKVKVTTTFPEWPLLRQTPSMSGIWDDYKFYINEEIDECDYWVVFDGLLKPESTKCPKKNTILITGEPPSIKTYSRIFVNQFNLVVSCHKNIKHKNVKYSQQSHPWFVEKNYDELINKKKINKTKLLSIIISNKTYTEGHRKRYKFAMEIKEHFKDKVDLFGRGLIGFEDKGEVL